jgi:hypothetical protein
VTIDEIAKAAEEEIAMRYGIGPTEPSEIIARHFAPLAEQRDRLLAACRHVMEEADDKRDTYWQADPHILLGRCHTFAEQGISYCEADGKGTNPCQP